MTRSPITTHVLDLVRGRPAAGVSAVLEFFEPEGWSTLAQGVTDADGRITTFLAHDAVLKAGSYRLRFDTDPWFLSQQLRAFYPEVSITFRVEADGGHYHVPLLLGPFSYSTYRGS